VGILHEDQYTFFIISRSFLLRMRNVSDPSCRGNQNTYFVLNNFFSENRTVYEIMWKNSAQQGKPQITILRMRIARWTTKATHAHVTSYLLLFHCNNGCANAPQCYVKRTLTVLFISDRYIWSVSGSRLTSQPWVT